MHYANIPVKAYDGQNDDGAIGSQDGPEVVDFAQCPSDVETWIQGCGACEPSCPEQQSEIRDRERHHEDLSCSLF